MCRICEAYLGHRESHQFSYFVASWCCVCYISCVWDYQCVNEPIKYLDD